MQQDVENLPYHRKYRPSRLDDYVGLDKVKETALKAINSASRPQTILLFGDSGCGKTTLARILAKEYNCSDRSEEKGACGTCPSCISMDEYITTGSTDMIGNVKEVDIGTDSGKNDLEGVFQDIEIPPMGDEWKVYIFDEIQSASIGLQNRLLKITEEPPEHVVFMFCTTNPERILPTLKNRCQLKLRITKPNVQELSGLLAKVCNLEGVEYDRAGLEFICNRNEFCIRDSLQNLWQVVMEQNSAKHESVTKVFEEVSSSQLIGFFRTLKSKDIFGFVTVISQVKTKMELKTYLSELRRFLVRGIYVINSISVEGVTDSELKTYRNLFGDMSVLELGTLMDRLLNIDMNNLELDLLMLGYKGLVPDIQGVSDPSNLAIPELSDECKLEIGNANKILAETQKAEYEEGVKNADALMEDIDFDMLLSMGAKVIDS